MHALMPTESYRNLHQSARVIHTNILEITLNREVDILCYEITDMLARQFLTPEGRSASCFRSRALISYDGTRLNSATLLTSASC